MTAHVATNEVSPMPSANFDTLAYCKKLKAAGVPEAQAEIHAEALAETIDEKLPTKKDIYALKKDLKELEERLSDKLTIRFGGMLVVAVMILGVLIKIL